MLPVLVTGPAVEPVTLAEMKLYLRLDGDDEDDLVSALIGAARLQVEAATRCALVAQTWRCLLGRWPASRAVPLPLWPVLALDSVAVTDAAGVAHVIDAGLTRLDAGCDPARLLVDGTVPDPGRSAGGIAVTVTAGFGAGPQAVPAPLRQAIRMRVARWFESRGDAEPLPAALPGEVEALIAPFRRRRLA